MNHKGENWPYHANMHTGEMTPCASNPCKLHGNSDVLAKSPEEAYEKKFGSSTPGLFNSKRTKHPFALDPVLVGIKATGGLIAGLLLSSGIILGTQYFNVGTQSEAPATVISQSAEKKAHYRTTGKRGRVKFAYDTVIKNKNGDEVKIYTSKKLNKGDNQSVKEQVGLYGMTIYKVDGDNDVTIGNTDDANKPVDNKTRNPIIDGAAMTASAAIAMGVAELIREQKDKTGQFRERPRGFFAYY